MVLRKMDTMFNEIKTNRQILTDLSKESPFTQKSGQSMIDETGKLKTALTLILPKV